MRRKEILNVNEVSTNKLTIAECYNNFITEKKAENCSAYTIRFYNNGVNYFLKDCIYIDEITKDLINSLIVKERETHPNDSIRTTNDKVMALRAFVYYLQEQDLLPQFQIKLLKFQQQPKETYSNNELQALIKKPKTTNWVVWRNWAIVNYLIGTGNRASSVINIKIKDIDFGLKTVNLEHTKNKKAQIIPITDSLLKVLDLYLKTWDWTEEDYLFPTNEGKQLQVRSLQSEIARYNKARGVSKTSIHLFRHSYAKSFLLAGGSVSQLQKLLGHSTPQMSLHYAQVYNIEDLALNYNKLNPLELLQN